MAKKKQQPKKKSGSGKWTTFQLVFFLVLTFIIGIGVGMYIAEGGSNTMEQTDEYGRTPDDPHYGHDHP